MRLSLDFLPQMRLSLDFLPQTRLSLDFLPQTRLSLDFLAQMRLSLDFLAQMRHSPDLTTARTSTLRAYRAQTKARSTPLQRLKIVDIAQKKHRKFGASQNKPSRLGVA